jgi:outer membrane protein assembly factor BamA
VRTPRNIALLPLILCICSLTEVRTQENDTLRTIDIFPILMYDTDVGFGYGGKVFFLNQLGHRESFDVTAFNSTKGERWYRFVFSIPDFELRQGTLYPLALDVTADYDRFLHNNFFGIGNESRREDGETYTKEPLELSVGVSRGFNERIVGQITVRSRTVHNLNFDRETSRFALTLPPVNHGRSSIMTLSGSVRYDSRDSNVNPTSGHVLQLALEAGPYAVKGDYTLWSISTTLQSYHPLFPNTVIAFRWQGQVIDGSNIPIHAYPSLGGNRTLRGYPQDRFLDRTLMLLNAELRFPIISRLGAVVGFDAGNVWSAVHIMSFHRWASNGVIGLRYYLDTFVVRADLGWSKEGTGFYLNFGQVF